MSTGRGLSKTNPRANSQVRQGSSNEPLMNKVRRNAYMVGRASQAPDTSVPSGAEPGGRVKTVRQFRARPARINSAMPAG